MSKRMIKRQQVKIWMEENNLNVSEESVANMFKSVMDNMNEYKNLTLRQAYCCSYIEMMQRML